MIRDLYSSAMALADEIESELRSLDRWTSHPLTDEKFENMGAFGSNTMSFEQWLQFVLLDRIRTTVQEKGTFPSESMVAAYAVHYFDGDDGAGRLIEILGKLDDLINGDDQADDIFETDSGPPKIDTVTVSDKTIPTVVYALADLLPQFEGDALESQLQTFDTFVAILDSSTRPEVSAMLRGAALKCTSAVVRTRIEQAAAAILTGQHAAEPYDHEKAMKKYMEEFKKDYPDPS